MAIIDERLIHNAMLTASNIQDRILASNYHCEVNQKLLIMGRRQAMHCKGNFCLSFKMWGNNTTTDSLPSKCVRVWFADVTIEKERFTHISNALSKAHLPYFTDFKYVEHGVNIEGNIVPAIFMDWIDGQTLTNWLPANSGNPGKIKALVEKFRDMCLTLNKLGIAHGDLCSENILITPNGEIKLVDYDSVHVPAMGNRFKPITNGWKEFQHPDRSTAKTTSARDDYFSQHVIYLSLLAYSVFPSLIDIEAKSLLFEGEDYRNEQSYLKSRAYQYLQANYKKAGAVGEQIKQEMEILRQAIAGKFQDVQPLKQTSNVEPQKQRYVPYCIHCGYKFPGSSDKYCHMCGNVRLVYATT